MPRRKKEVQPVSSQDLKPHGEGILTGIALDPFEAKTWVIEGLVDGFADLSELGNLGLTLDNPGPGDAMFTLTLKTEASLTAVRLQIGKRVTRFSRRPGSWVVQQMVPEGRELKPRLLVSTTTVVDFRGELTLEGEYT